VDIPAHGRAAARKGRDQRLVLPARLAGKPAEDDILDRQLGRILLAQSKVLLAVALRDLDGVVDIVNRHILCSRDMGFQPLGRGKKGEGQKEKKKKKKGSLTVGDVADAA
jgi:hypothetical protein